MKPIYINEPLTQKLPAFYNFMGGWSFVKSVQQLNKLMIATPRHWRGTKIAVEYKRGNRYYTDVSAVIYENDILVYCNHANQEIEPVSFSAGMDDEYTLNLSVCQKCGAGWDEDGEQRLEEL